MISEEGITFEQAVEGVSDSLVLLDVDGTLLPDGGIVITDETVRAARRLTARNKVYLVSNGSDLLRMENFSKLLGIPIATAGVPAGKPSVSALEGIETKGMSLVVMGDKHLTDGAFARNIGARFILIDRKRSGEESGTVRFSYWVDRVVSWFL